MKKQHPPTSVDRLLRLPEVIHLTGLSKATIYRYMKMGDFPDPVQLGKRAVAWRTSAISAWNDSR